ncbi:ubiquinol oxidase subunit II (plasmid) [Asticcacaulis sp. DW145]|uniref:Ubiquinol oxidase subunit 2 n=2 Tax=Asticcacaulis TaxID=76890 RepID=A0ABT5IE91_9CAUL|nr:ubiquinol oxidase subunit II [Asticcacaulis currens]BEV12904.1 ubiquinol oxidase subunit II [Asticcacaulis sp. DW145]
MHLNFFEGRNLIRKGLIAGLMVTAAVSLSGCDWALMDPKGPVGLAQKDLIILATLLMLIPVVPVIVMTLWFAWRYRASNTKATYDPNFEHSNRIEAVVWAIPTLIIIALGTVTWISTHQLDPHKKVEAAADKAGVTPIEVQVVALDWKWLFIYPQYGIATVNEMAMPVGVPVHFEITSASVMNSFFIPQLGTQIYAMNGMQTHLSLRADHAGVYDGISANYSGFGFADMKFKAKAVDQTGFDAWVASAKASGQTLDAGAYKSLHQKSTLKAPAYYAAVQPALFTKVLNGCADGGLCKEDAFNMAMMKNLVPGAVDCVAPEILTSKNKTADKVALNRATPES